MAVLGLLLLTNNLAVSIQSGTYSLAILRWFCVIQLECHQALLLLVYMLILSFKCTGTRQIFFQRRNTDVQQECEEIFSVAHQQRNANQSYNRYITSHHSEWPLSKSLQIVNAGEGVKKRESSCTVSRNVSWYSHYGKQYGGSLKN